ncbi:hypothetical protein KDL44_11345 [bacterium]|nr:hypothetical protein [bacterium]
MSKRIPAILSILWLIGLLSACQRSNPDADRGLANARATHPWQLPSGSRDYNRTLPGSDTPEIPADGKVQRPLGRGPQFNENDTIDEQLVPGSWVQVGQCINEKLDLRNSSNYNTLTFQANGSFRQLIYGDGEITGEISGVWDKTAPGVLTMTVSDQNGSPLISELHCEMFGRDFLFMWSYSDHLGLWYARQVQDEPLQMIGWNRYDSNLGEIFLSNVGKDSYYGELTTSEGSSWQLNGYLVDGILNMAWIDSANNASGFAAFTVEGDWDTLNGTLWKNDYEAAPFAGPFTASADRSN